MVIDSWLIFTRKTASKKDKKLSLEKKVVTEDGESTVEHTIFLIITLIDNWDIV